MTNALQLIAKSNSVSLSLSRRDSAALTLAVKTLSPGKITDALQHRSDVAEEIMSLSSSLHFFRNEYSGNSKEDYIAIVADKLSKARAEFAELLSLKSLAQLKEENADELHNDLEWIILDTIKYFDVPKESIMGYSHVLAQEIPVDYPALTIEDILLCFQAAKDGHYGNIYARLDGQVIKGWLRRYSEDRDELVTNRNTSRHMASKAGKEDGRSSVGEDPAKLLDLAKTQIALDHATKK